MTAPSAYIVTFTDPDTDRSYNVWVWPESAIGPTAQANVAKGQSFVRQWTPLAGTLAGAPGALLLEVQE